jgi:prevent-host-death family protein
MNTVTMEQAKENLEELVEQAAHGEPFQIVQPGKPGFEIIAVRLPELPIKRTVGFLKGKFKVPGDFDTMAADEIRELFEGVD